MSPTELVDEAWRRLEARWHDADAHRAFRSTCASLGKLDEAARRYRQVAESDPVRAASARTELEALMAEALASLAATRSPRPRRTRTPLFFVALSLATVLVLGALWASLHGS
ncbi:MAG: hypothetical protein RMK74_09015 [Myxococcales bacterium]|nr:hypothetical protein [Myxococcales bacterium]